MKCVRCEETFRYNIPGWKRAPDGIICRKCANKPYGSAPLQVNLSKNLGKTLQFGLDKFLGKRIDIIGKNKKLKKDSIPFKHRDQALTRAYLKYGKVWTHIKDFF